MTDMSQSNAVYHWLGANLESALGITVKYTHLGQVTHICQWTGSSLDAVTGMILGLGPANERNRYFVTAAPIGWTQA